MDRIDRIIRKQQQREDFLDDCVATCEVYRCMQDKGMEDLDRDSITLAPAKFEQCFPGVAWQPVETEDGPVGISFKSAAYRGFYFWCFTDTEEITFQTDASAAESEPGRAETLTGRREEACTGTGREETCTGGGRKPARDPSPVCAPVRDDREKALGMTGEGLEDGDR